MSAGDREAAVHRDLDAPEIYGELCVSELAELEGEKLSTVSARLKSLLAVRLVTRRRDAKHIFYALADDHVLSLIRSAVEHAAEKS